MAENLTAGHSRWGHITVVEPGEQELASPYNSEPVVSIHKARYVWRPNPCLSLRDVWFKIEFDCLTGPDGTRRFVPATTTDEFVLLASVIGFQILAETRELTAEQKFSYHAMRLLYQHAGRLRESYGRTFKRRADLLITAQVRGDHNDVDVLPNGLGTFEHGGENKWSVNELISRGRAAATDAGIAKPDEQTCIRWGLYEAARLNPIDTQSLSQEDTRTLIRLTLFDLGPVAESVDEEIKARVVERLCEAIKKHQADANEAFHTWFFENLDNIVHQIAKRTKGGGTVDRETVRQVILELVFDAHIYVADCVQLAVEAFLAALPAALSPDGRQLFKAIYYRQNELGGLPLVMLRNRFSDMHEAAVDVLNAPTDPSRMGVLLRLFQYYAEMASKRRRADREYKDRRQHRNAAGRTSINLEIGNFDTVTPNSPSEFSNIASELRRRRGANCNCANTDSWVAMVGDSTSSDKPVIHDGCTVCDHFESYEVSIDELRDIASQFGRNEP